jgi:putative heme iron utilization protein
MGRAEATPGRRVRNLVRETSRAGLATLLAGEASPAPYVSLVLVALDHDASPLLLLSDLADHTKNLHRDPRAALLFDGTGGWRDPLAGPRASLLGQIQACDDERLKARFLARHPNAAVYAGFTDFHLYRMAVERVHLVAGFGDIHWLDAGAVLFDTAETGALAVAEPDIVAHMNEDHGEAVRAIANEIAGSPGEGLPGEDLPGEDLPGEDLPGEDLPGEDWSMSGIDPEGVDFRSGGGSARVAFETPVHTAAEARRELVRLTKAARAQAAQT